jgi:hypothetical protein
MQTRLAVHAIDLVLDIEEGARQDVAIFHDINHARLRHQKQTIIARACDVYWAIQAEHQRHEFVRVVGVDWLR